MGPVKSDETVSLDTQVNQAFELVAEKTELCRLLNRFDSDALPVSDKEKSNEFSLQNPPQTPQDRARALTEGDIDLVTVSLHDSQVRQDETDRARARLATVEEQLKPFTADPAVGREIKIKIGQEVTRRLEARQATKLERLEDELTLKINQRALASQKEKRQLTELERQTIAEWRELRKKAQARRTVLETNEALVPYIRRETLKKYRRQIEQYGFAVTPSRRTNVHRLEKLWSEGRHVLITGHSGVGKTELFKYAARRFFGAEPYFYTGNPETTKYDLLGRIGVEIPVTNKADKGAEEVSDEKKPADSASAKKGDVYRPSEFIKSMTARGGRGVPFLYDEFNATPPKANIGLKTLLNVKPGERTRIPDLDIEITVGPDYSFTATANIKSEKYVTREDIDPAMARMFDPLPIDYMLPEELYDVIGAVLYHERFDNDFQPAVLIKNLTDAAYAIQQGYKSEPVHLEGGGVLQARAGGTTGTQAKLEKAVLDPGRVKKMIEGWRAAEARGEKFYDYLNDQLLSFVNNETYPPDDRYYMVEILALKGFFKGHKPAEFGTIGVTQADMERWGAVIRPAGEVTVSDLTEARRYLQDQVIGEAEIKNIIETKLAVAGLDVTFELPKVPFEYTAKDLEIARELDAILFTHPAAMVVNGERKTITVENLLSLFEGSQLEELIYALNPNVEDENKDWMRQPNQTFAHTEVLAPGYKLIKSTVLDDSTGKTYGAQENLLDKFSQELNDKGGAHMTVSRRTSVTQFWQNMAYFLARDIKLDEEHDDWGESLSADGYRVNAGWDDNGFSVGHWHPGGASGRIGVVPQW